MTSVLDISQERRKEKRKVQDRGDDTMSQRAFKTKEEFVNKIKEYVARVKELGMNSAAITDHGVMY